ncbi:MAG: efflux RND transporter permease subunit [Gammaproteobacteria bacterium]|nr:efflux RND transporter permease subunit [Gammaproteobacteria bacterium]
MKSLIRFFADRLTLSNVLTFLIVFLGLSSLSVIQRDNFPSVDFLEMTVTTRYPGASPEDVELNVTNRIEEELKEVDGLDKYTSFSMENISIVHIWIDRDAEERYRIPVRDVVAAIRNRNIRATGGSFESYTSEKNIVTLSEFSDPMDAGEAIVKLTEGGATVRVQDLAAVRDGFEPAKILSRMNGKPAISFLVFKKESADGAIARRACRRSMPR